MPITAKLSREFYDRLGDSVANELVEMLNTVDLNYKTELRGLNELNFARFDAKVEQRFAESAASIDKRFAESNATMDKRFAEFAIAIDRRFSALEQHVERTQARILMWSFSFWVTTLVALYAFTRGGR